MKLSKITSILFLFSLGVSILPVRFVSASTEIFSAVTTDALSVRTGPAKTYKKLTTLKKGSTVSVYEQKGSWSRISTAQKWVATDYLKKSAAVKTASAKIAPAPKVVTTTTAIEPSLNWVPSDSESSELSTTTSTAKPATVSANLTKPSTTCMSEIMKANAYCKSISSGCASYSKTPKCLAANEACEARQQQALDDCPSAN